MRRQETWTKPELLQDMKHADITFSSSMIDKFVGYGLLSGRPDSNGQGKGRKHSTYHRAVENLQLLQEWKKTPKRKYKQMLILLYWRGLTVNYDMLYTQLQELHFSMKSTFAEAPDYVKAGKSSVEDHIREQLLPEFTQSRSGPLDKKRKKQFEKAVDEKSAAFIELLRGTALMLQHGGLVPEALEAFGRFHNPDPENASPIDISPEILALPYFDPATWKERMEPKADPQENEDHRAYMCNHLAELVSTLEGYARELMDSPLAQTELFQRGLTTVSELNISTSPGLLLPALYGLVASGYSTTLVEYLKRPSSQEAWPKLLYDFSNAINLFHTKGGDPDESNHR